MSPKKFWSMLRDTSVPSGSKTVLIGTAPTIKTRLRARGTEAASEPSCAEKPTSSAIVELSPHYHGRRQFGIMVDINSARKRVRVRQGAMTWPNLYGSKLHHATQN
jgi:hypothetical protein